MNESKLTATAQQMLKTLGAYLPTLLAGIAMLLIGWIIIRQVCKMLSRLLQRVGVDKLSDYINRMELFGEQSITFRLSHFISSFVYYFLLLMLWVLVADVLGIEALSQLLDDVISYMPNLLVAAIYLMAGVFFADIARKFVKNTLRSLAIPSANLIAGFVFYFLLINILLAALAQARINTDFIADNLSIILGGIVLAFAIGYGLGSKDIAKNIISGFYWRGKMNVGDQVQIDGIAGQIVRIEKTHIVVQNDDGNHMIPISKLSTHTVIIR